jgi:hypothetical protein
MRVCYGLSVGGRVELCVVDVTRRLGGVDAARTEVRRARAAGHAYVTVRRFTTQHFSVTRM